MNLTYEEQVYRRLLMHDTWGISTMSFDKLVEEAK